jgi:hypothetical protein
MNPIEIALEYERMGYQPIPLAPRAKVPKEGFSLIEHYDRIVSVKEEAAWYADANIGLVTGKLIVVDIDAGKEKARDFYKKWKHLLKTINETRRGIHAWFKASSPNFPSGQFEDGDLKASRGFVLAPPSTVVDYKTQAWWRYRFVDGHDLAPYDELPTYEPGMVTLRVSGRVAIRRGEVRDAIGYVMKVESVEGTNSTSRDNGLIRAVSILRDAGMTEAEATVVMLNWNNSGKAVPPWSLKELTRAISRTFAKGA